MNASAPVSCLRPCDLRIDFTYLSVMALMRESRALIESSASFIARFIESTLCERRPILVLQSDISPSRRLSWLRRCSVSRVLSWIFRLVSLISPALRCLACFTSAAVRGFAWFCFLCLDVCCLLEPVLRFFAVVRVVFCCCFCAKTGSAIWPPNRAEISIMIPRRRFIARIRRC